MMCCVPPCVNKQGLSNARANATTGRIKTRRAEATTTGETKQNPLVGQLYQLSLVLLIGTKSPIKLLINYHPMRIKRQKLDVQSRYTDNHYAEGYGSLLSSGRSTSLMCDKLDQPP